MKKKQKRLEDQVAKKLHDAGIEFDREISIGGIKPDFVVNAPDGRKFIIEVKNWEKYQGFRNRAAHLANLYKDKIGADEAFLVIENLERSSVTDGVVTIDKLIPAIVEAFSKKPKRKRKGKTTTISKIKKRKIFAAMPFDQKYDDVYFVAMSHAAAKNDAICDRIDKIEFTGDIVKEIHRRIKQSIAVIADLSESYPNVLYEIGFANGIKKPIIPICSTPLEELPFDISHWNTIKYNSGQTYRLRKSLTERLKAVI